VSLKFSIITPSLNQGRFIRDTIESVLDQGYANFEHIIIDGGSTDETINILKEYRHLKWICEKDCGPANAINKGFGMATGDIHSWLNSDDYYAKNIFPEINYTFNENRLCEYLYGNLTFVSETKHVLTNDKTHPPSIELFIHETADLLRQPCTFFKKNLLEKVGFLDESLNLVFDYDLFIKMLMITKPIYIDKNIAFQRMYDTTLTKRNLSKQAIEIYKTSRKYGAKIYDRILYRSILKKFLFPNSF